MNRFFDPVTELRSNSYDRSDWLQLMTVTALFTNIVPDILFALRQFIKRPGTFLTSIVVLALGIGSCLTVFSVLYQIVLKPLPYPNADRLLFIHNRFPKGQVSTTGVSAFDYAAIKRHNDVFSEAGIFYYNDLVMTGIGAARHLDVVNASSSLFEMFRVKPKLGRAFHAVEDSRGAAGTALLSDRLWRNYFNADPNVLGRVVYLNGSPFTVLGVMPASFQFPSRDTEIWIPVALPEGGFSFEGGRMEKWLHMVARLAPNVSAARANAALENITSQLAAQFPAYYPAKDGWHFTFRQLADEETEAIRRWLYVALGAVASVLLISCINVSGLLLIRGAARSGELAIRSAVGATRSRIVQQQLTETGLLVFVGCVLGLFAASWGLHLVNLYGPISQPVPMSEPTIIVSLTMIVFCTFGAGLAPAVLAARLLAEQTLKSSATRTSTGGATFLTGVVAVQLAFAIALIFTATQLNRSFLNLTNVPTGFEPRRLWTGAVTLPSHHSHAAGQSQNTNFFQPLLTTLRTLPGVQSVSGGPVPFNPSGVWTEEFRRPERPGITPHPEAQIGLAFPGYFETLGIPLIEGRCFTDRDRAGSQTVAVIDRDLARRYFPNEDPIGKLIASGGAPAPATIIGVVGTVHNSDLGGPTAPEVYYSALQESADETYLALRMSGDVDPSNDVRRVIAKLNSDAALYDTQFMEERVASSFRIRRFVTFLLSGVAAMGLTLAIIGLYGALSHLVELRRREIGIRVTLGAQQYQLVWMILRRAALILAAGISAGALIAAVAGFTIRSQLFGVSLTDSLTWIGALSSIATVSLIASFIPAWRAAHIEPSIILRDE